MSFKIITRDNKYWEVYSKVVMNEYNTAFILTDNGGKEHVIQIEDIKEIINNNIVVH